MKKLLILSLITIIAAAYGDIDESRLGPAFNAKHQLINASCSDYYPYQQGDWYDNYASEGMFVPSGVSDCVDLQLWSSKQSKYYDRCCYVRFQKDGVMHSGCIGLSEENYLDTSITMERMEDGDRLIWTRNGINSKVYQLDCFSSYLKKISFASILLLALFF